MKKKVTAVFVHQDALEKNFDLATSNLAAEFAMMYAML